LSGHGAIPAWTLPLCKFGDKRLQTIGVLLMERLFAVGQSGVSVRKLCGSRAGELRLGHLPHSPKVRTATMIETAFTCIAAHVSGRCIVAAQDIKGLRDDGTRHSHQLRVAIALDAETGALIGLVHASFHRRAGGQKARSPSVCSRTREVAADSTRSKPAAASPKPVLPPPPRSADAEYDIYDASARRPASVEMAVRGHHDRVLADATRLFAATGAVAEWGARDRRTARQPRPRRVQRDNGAEGGGGDDQPAQAQHCGRDGGLAARIALMVD
jgi:hypothetical protein